MAGKNYTLDKLLRKKARMLALAGDPTRLRILCFMFDHKEACVSEISKGLNMSIASISHHLQIMKEEGFFKTNRMGTKICYTLEDTEFVNLMKNCVELSSV